MGYIDFFDIQEWPSGDVDLRKTEWVEAFRLAIIERLSVCSAQYRAIIWGRAQFFKGVQIPVYENPNMQRHLSITGMFYGLMASVEMGQWINHTDHSGNWDGQTGWRLWNVSSLAKEAGAYNLPTAQNVYTMTLDDLNEWGESAKSMINLLLYRGLERGARGDALSFTSRWYSQTKTLTSSPSWATAKSSFLANPYSSDTVNSSSDFFWARGYQFLSADRYEIRHEKRMLRIRPSTAPVQEASGIDVLKFFIPFSVDIYAYSYNNYDGNPLFTWIPIGAIDQENKMNLVKSVTETTDLNEEVIEIGATELATVPQPTTVPTQYYVNYYNTYPVIKFNGLNGFKFK